MKKSETTPTPIPYFYLDSEFFQCGSHETCPGDVDKTLAGLRLAYKKAEFDQIKVKKIT